MSGTGTGASATGWLVAQEFVVTPSINGRVAAFPISNYFLNLPASISALGFEIVYGRVVSSTTQFDVKTCGLSLISGRPGGGTGTSGFVGTDQANIGIWTTTSAQITAGAANNLLGLAAAFASAGFVNSHDMGFALRARVSGTGGATLNPRVAAFQLRFYYDLPHATEPGQPEFGWKVNAPQNRNTTDTGWLSPTSAITLSAAASGVVVVDNISNILTIDGIFTSALFDHDGDLVNDKEDSIFLFFDVPRPGKTVLVSGVEVVFYGKSLSAATPASYRLLVVSERSHYSPYTVASSAKEVRFTTVCAAVTIGRPTDLWTSPLAQSEISANTIFISADGGQGAQGGFRILHTDQTNNFLALDGAKIKITYSMVGIGEQGAIGLTAGNRSINVIPTPEFSFELRQTPLTQNNNIGANSTSSEYGFEVNSTQILSNIVPIQSDYGFEATSTSLLLQIVPIRSSYGFEATSTSLLLQIVPIRSNYGFELLSVAQTQQNSIGANTSNAEFGFEAASIQDRIVEIINTPEFGYEQSTVGIKINVRPIRSTYGYESTSIAIDKIVSPDASEYGYENDSIRFIRNFVSQPDVSEYGFEITEPHIAVLHTTDIFSAEFTFESGSPLLRQFSRVAATDGKRIKKVRQL